MVSHSDSFSGETSRDPSHDGAIVPSNGNQWPTETLARPEILTIHPRPVDLLNALRRRWIWALGLGILSAVLAVLAGMLLIEENFTATAWLRIASETPNIMFSDKGADEFLNHRRAQSTLMKSNFVLSAALRKEGVAQLPYIRDEIDGVTWLKRNVGVSFPGNSEILQISMTGDDPIQLKKLVDAVKDAYMDEVVTVDRASHLRRKSALRTAYHRNMEDIKRKTYAYKLYANKIVSADSDVAKQKALYELEGINDLRKRVRQEQQRISGLDRRIKYYEAQKNALSEPEKNRDENSIVSQIVEATLPKDPYIAYASQRIQSLELAKFRLSLLPNRRGGQSPAVLKLHDQVEKLKEGIAKRRELLIPSVAKQAQEYITQGYRPPLTQADRLDAMIAGVELDKMVTQGILDTALEQFTEAADKAKQLGTESTELESLKIDLDRLKRMTHRMGDELVRREIEMAAEARVTVLEHATVPKSSDIKKKRRKVAFIGLAAFCLAVIGVAAIDFLSRRVSSTNEVAYGLGVQVIGDLPMLSGRMWRHRSTLNGAASRPLHGMLIESIDNIRTALLHRAHSEALRTVLVTSALEQEGKTTLSSQLSASLARSGRRTLLVDGDLRRPSSHRLFELPVEPGISEVLRGEVDLDQIIRPTRVPGLWLASAGTCDLDAIQALAKGDFRESFEQLREEFDFVIIDSGPVLTDADALLFGQYTDGVILSVLRDVSRVPRVFEAVQRIRAVDLRLLGAVVNGVSFGKYRSYYRPYTVQVDAAPVP